MDYCKHPHIPFGKQDVEAFLGALKISEASNEWGRVEFFLNSKSFARIERFADDETRQTIARSRERLALAKTVGRT